jgi:hypothetical protein
MSGRRAVNPAQPGARAWWTATLAGAVVLVAIGIGVGSRIGPTRSAVTTTVTVTSPAEPENSTAGEPKRANPGHSEQGAITAAATYLGVLDGPTLLDSDALITYVRAIAARGSRADLVTAYEQAASQVREQLGLDTDPKPVVIVRAGMLGYRVDEFSLEKTTVAVWRVGIVGSGANVDPQQSWRTETVSLVWQAGAWKVAALASEPGPTPPLETTDTSTPAELFTSVPRFTDFAHAAP